MNEPAPPRWTSTASLPPPTIYDPGDDEAAPFGGAVPAVVLLLVGDEELGWAARTAIALSDRWATAGRKVVLADFHLENPVLQEELGGHGLEGVVDLFLYGASMARCTRSVEGREFQFLPTGTYTPDADAVFRHPRWSKLVAGFQHSRATLVIFAPANAADLGALATWVDQVLLVGTPRAPEQITPLLQAGTEIRGLIVPPRGESAIPPPLPRLPHSPRDLETAARQRRSEDDELHLPPPPTRVPHRGHRAAVLVLWVLLGAAVLTAVGYVVASVRPDLMPWASAPPDSAQAAAGVAPAGSGAPRPLGEPLPFSVRVAAFQTFDAAGERLDELQQQVPGVLFFITPEVVQGMTYHSVMAGALPDVEVAREVRDVLVTSEAIDPAQAADDWSLILETRYSLVLGDLDTRGAANAAVDSLLARQVPAYPLAVPYSDGVLRWYLYAGAFPDSTSAEPLRAQLAGAGLQPRLTPRFGSPASPEL
jgi:hypothetical protein